MESIPRKEKYIDGVRYVFMIRKPHVGDWIKMYHGIDDFSFGRCVGIVWDKMVSTKGEFYMREKALVRRFENVDNVIPKFFLEEKSYKIERI